MNTQHQLTDWQPYEGYWTVAAALALCDFTKKTKRKFRECGEYVNFCRRRYPEIFNGRDGRLIGAAYNRLGPKSWTTCFDSFVEYWGKAVQRSDVGSLFNLTPEIIFDAWRAKWPAWIVKACGDRLVSLGGIRRCTRPALRRFRRVARAINRNTWRCLDHRRWTTKALEALGQLCPELQMVAVETWRREKDGYGDLTILGNCGKKVKVRDINWARVDRFQKMLLADKSNRVRIALSIRKQPNRRTASLIGPWINVQTYDYYHQIVIKLVPNFCYVSLAQAKRLVLGETPQQLSGDILTKKEAHIWLKTFPQMPPLEWLKNTVDPNLPIIRSQLIIRWLENIKKRGLWRQLMKTRRAFGPGRELCEYKLIDKVDEIQDIDLTNGIKTQVFAAFENVAIRTSKLAMLNASDKVLQTLPRGWKLFKNMRHLNTAKMLADEGECMENCVGGYAYAVERNQSVILSIELKKKNIRSTVELTNDGHLLQHRGPRNTEAHICCWRVLNKWMDTYTKGGSYAMGH